MKKIKSIDIFKNLEDAILESFELVEEEREIYRYKIKPIKYKQRQCSNKIRALCKILSLDKDALDRLNLIQDSRYFTWRSVRDRAYTIARKKYWR